MGATVGTLVVDINRTVATTTETSSPSVVAPYLQNLLELLQQEVIFRITDPTQKPFSAALNSLSIEERTTTLKALFVYFKTIALIQPIDDPLMFASNCVFYFRYLCQVCPNLTKLVMAVSADDNIIIPFFTDLGLSKIIEYYQGRGKLPKNSMMCPTIFDLFDKLIELQTQPDNSEFFLLLRTYTGKNDFYLPLNFVYHIVAIKAVKDASGIRLIFSDSVGAKRSYLLFKMILENVKNLPIIDKEKYVQFIHSCLKEIAVVVNERQVDETTCFTYAIKDLIALYKDPLQENLQRVEDGADVVGPIAEEPQINVVSYRACNRMMKACQHLSKMPGEFRKKITKHIHSVQLRDGAKERNFLSKNRATRMFEVILNSTVFA
jgi:hypothetical protein